jgi:hypothetical protein
MSNPQPPPAGTFDPSAMGQQMWSQWESAMGTWWDKVLDSPDVMGALGGQLGQMAKGRKAYETAVDENLGKMHLPTRGDLVRVLRVASLLEDRLLQNEDRLLELGDRLVRAEREALEARIEAAEARVELRERLAAMEARLMAAVQVAPAPAPAERAAAAADTAAAPAAGAGARRKGAGK